MRANERLRVLTTVMRSFAEATTDLGQLLHVIARNVAEVSATPASCSCSGRATCSRQSQRMPWTQRPSARAQALVESDRSRSRHIRPRASAGVEGLVPRAEDRPDRAPGADDGAYAAYQREQRHPQPARRLLHAHGKVARLDDHHALPPTSPPFDEEDRELALNLADHASLAIANARL